MGAFLLRRQRITVAGLHLLVLALLGLHLYVRTLPTTTGALPEPGEAESAWWGLWPLRYAPAWAVAIGAAAVLVSLALFWMTEWANGQASKSSPPSAMRTTKRPHWAIFPALALLLALAFFTWPIAHTRWGDAYLLSRSIAWPDPALRLTHSWQAPLDLLIHSQVWLLGHARFGWLDAAPVYHLLSPLAGLLYLGVTLVLSRDETLAPPWLTFGLLTTLGIMQLFFGYIENYSFAAAGILAYLWLGLEALHGRRTLWPAAWVLALTHALHPSTIVLAPSLLYAGWHSTQTAHQRNKSRLPVVYSIVLPMAMVAASTLLLMELGGHGLAALLTTDRPGGGDGRWFVPLWTTSTRWEHYPLFSWPHLRDLLNQQLLVAPVVWPGLIWLFCLRWRFLGKSQGDWGRLGEISGDWPISPNLQTQQCFLAIAVFCYLFFICVWNPDYGGQRDWDLFSLAALPATLWLITLLPCALPGRRYLVAGAAPLILLQGLHTAAWIYQNTLPWQWP
jgi:hypothetical protein